MPKTEDKPRRTLAEILKSREEIKARLIREGKNNIAWHEDPELAMVMLELFDHYKHFWLPIKPRSKILYALCTGFAHRGGKPNDEGKPMCQGCARKMKGDFT